MGEMYKYKMYFEWEEFVNNCYKLSSLIKQNNLHTLPILSISRGGLLPGLIISHQLDNPKIDVIRVSSYDSDNKQRQIKIEQEPSIIYDKVLIVDDLVDSGETLNEVKKYLMKKNKNIEVYVAVIYSKNPLYPVSCKIEEIDPNAWIVFPYEKSD